jgi:hypothetical protein
VRRSDALQERYRQLQDPPFSEDRIPYNILCYISLAMMTDHGVTMVNGTRRSVFRTPAL